jgi:hypothetical protein
MRAGRRQDREERDVGKEVRDTAREESEKTGGEVAGRTVLRPAVNAGRRVIKSGRGKGQERRTSRKLTWTPIETGGGPEGPPIGRFAAGYAGGWWDRGRKHKAGGLKQGLVGPEGIGRGRKAS